MIIQRQPRKVELMSLPWGGSLTEPEFLRWRRLEAHHLRAGSTVAQFWGRLFHCETLYWSFACTIKPQISAFGIWEALLKHAP